MELTKKKDNIDIEVVNRPLTTKEKKTFSEFLKSRKKRKVRGFKREGTTTQQCI